LNESHSCKLIYELAKSPGIFSEQIKTLQKQIAENKNQLEIKEREQDSKQELEQSWRNQELIDSSKPKAKAAKQADEAKKAEAAKIDAAKKAKTVARRKKENRKKRNKGSKSGQRSRSRKEET
jgi:hypothetical protein